MGSRILSVLFIFLLLTTGCGKKMGFQAMEVPKEQARLQDLNDSSECDESDSFDDSDFSEEDGPSPLSKPSWKSLGDIAKWVVSNEAKKIGAACNFFIQRVLYLMGFGRGSWVANDFDSYVKESFDFYKKASFQYDSSGEERKRLKAYIWSFPEKTGLILQWKKNSAHGHIGIVQRIGEDLVIYHASLNSFRPKAQTITPEILLYRTGSSDNYTLNVFSDFKKSH